MIDFGDLLMQNKLQAMHSRLFQFYDILWFQGFFEVRAQYLKSKAMQNRVF